MAKLENLLNDLANLDAEHDLEGMRNIRLQIVDEHPDSEEAAEAQYKIGLDLLFRERQLQAAVEKFELAAKRKHPFWSAAARTSLGLCYFHQGRTQKAFFELRKVGYPETPTVHSATALAFIENIMETQNNYDEARRVRKDRIIQLEDLVRQARESNDTTSRGYHLYMLALALREQGEDDRSNAILDDAKDLGPDVLGADLYRSIIDALN